MNEIAIRVENLSKEYHIKGLAKTYTRLGDQIVDTLATPARRLKKLLAGQATGAADLDEKIWALKDISFEVRRGEVVGVIGRCLVCRSDFWVCGYSKGVTNCIRVAQPDPASGKFRLRCLAALEVRIGSRL